MKYCKWMHSDRIAIFAIFLGTAALVSWIGGGIFNMFLAHSLGGIFWILYSALQMPLLPILAVAGLWWGLKILHGRASWRKSLAIAIAPVLLLSPVLSYAGILLPMESSISFSNHLLPERIAQTSVSPDGRHTACILIKEGMGDSLRPCYLSINGSKRIKIEEIEEMNKAHKIHWSPDSGIVIFEKQTSLIAVRVRDQVMKEMPLLSDMDNKGYIHGSLMKSIEFREPGVFTVCYENKAQNRLVDMR